MKRVTSIVLVFILLLCSFQMVYAKDSESGLILEDTKNKPMKISIEEAIKLTLENSSQLRKIDCDILDAKDAVKDQKDAKDKIVKRLDSSNNIGAEMYPSEGYLNVMLTKKGYYVKSAKIKLTLAEYQKKQLTADLEMGAKTAYYKFLLAQKTVKLYEINLTKANDQLKVVKFKFDNGSITKLEVLKAELSVNKAQMDLDNAKDNLALELLSFKNTLGIDFDDNIILTDDVEYVPHDDIDLGKTINQAKQQRLEVIESIETLELQKIEHEAYTSYYTSSNSHHKRAIRKLEYAESNVVNTYRKIELDVRRKYLELVKAERALKNMDKTIELSLETARITSIFYNYGMSTALELLGSENELTQAQVGKYQLLIEYKIKKMMFDNACGIKMNNNN